ncbi:hypothetical protein OROHE_011508 [Orobanche hederae]
MSFSHFGLDLGYGLVMEKSDPVPPFIFVTVMSSSYGNNFCQKCFLFDLGIFASTQISRLVDASNLYPAGYLPPKYVPPDYEAPSSRPYEPVQHNVPPSLMRPPQKKFDRRYSRIADNYGLLEEARGPTTVGAYITLEVVPIPTSKD